MANDLFLTCTLENATLVRFPSSEAAFERFVVDRLDAHAGLKPALLANAEKLRGSRVLKGRYTVIGYSVGVPRGRVEGAKSIAGFVEDAKASGLDARAIEESGVRWVGVAPKGTAQRTKCNGSPTGFGRPEQAPAIQSQEQKDWFKLPILARPEA